MITLIAATALRHQDLFATPNGSIYETLRGSQDGGPLQARLWCAHPPDRLTCTPPRIDLQLGIRFAYCDGRTSTRMRGMPGTFEQYSPRTGIAATPGR